LKALALQSLLPPYRCHVLLAELRHRCACQGVPGPEAGGEEGLMASVEKRVRNGRPRWYARFRTPDGQQRTKTFARKVDAERFLVEVESRKQRDSFVDARREPDDGRVGDDWLAAQAYTGLRWGERVALVGRLGDAARTEHE
jgi:hypothetical protein